MYIPKRNEFSADRNILELTSVFERKNICSQNYMQQACGHDTVFNVIFSDIHRS